MLLIIVLSLVFLALALYQLALWDVFFGTCPEGQIKVITVGESYHDFFHSVTGYKKVGGKLESLGNGEKDRRGWMQRRLGIYWIGLWPIYKVPYYQFDWPTITRGEVEQIERKSKKVNTIIFRFEYPLEFKGMETSDNFKVTVVIQVLVEVFCPELARFKARNWLNVLKAAIESKVRDFVGTKTFEEIRGLKTEMTTEKDNFVKDILDLNKREEDDANPGMEDIIGVRIVTANFQRVDAEESDAVEALKKVATAQREGQAEVVKAEKKAEARRKEADGEKYFIENTLMRIAENERASAIEEVRSIPRTLITLVQKGAVNVSIGGGKEENKS
jgi:hypothetical protein